MQESDSLLPWLVWEGKLTGVNTRTDWEFAMEPPSSQFTLGDTKPHPISLQVAWTLYFTPKANCKTKTCNAGPGGREH